MIAEVAVPVAGVDGALSYLVPRAVESALAVGERVIVPVGTRRVVGLVVDVREEKSDERALKSIIEILDSTPVVDANQLALAAFVSRYYAAELGLCTRLVMPPDSATVVERRYQLSEQGERARVLSGDLKKSERDLLALFGPGERKKERALARTAGQRERLHKLVDAGLIEIVADERAVSAVRHDEIVHALPDGQALPKNAHALAAFDAWLRALKAPVPMIEAQAAQADARGKAKKLVALGRASIERVVVAGRMERGLLMGGLAATPTLAQTSALAHIEAAIEARATTAFLLEGVTGSGKTDVYLRALRATLARGRGAIIIVPEIGLTPQLVGRVRAALADRPDDVVVLHSKISVPERRDAYARLRDGTAKVAVGARSALFAPVRSLGLVVVDEEHDPSLKQDESPRYHARDVALWRAKNEGAVCVLGSATPSLESRHNVEQKKLALLELPARVGGGGSLPAVHIVDLRERAGVAEARKRDRKNVDEGPGVVLSAPLVEAMANALARDEQVLLFLNKRGYFSALLCEMCGHIETCPNCSVTLTLHKKKSALVCHQCDHEHLVPATCPDCGNDALMTLGLGTERLEAEVRARFPDARVARLDRDSTQRKGELEHVLAQVHAREVDVVVGTQMIAKGHDFPGVTLVGIVLADIALAMPDFRAGERAFALLAQVAGRAGRGEKPGHVFVQTFKPEAPAVHFALAHDVRGFAAQELAERALHRYPPFWRALLVRVEHEDPQVCARLAADAHSALLTASQEIPRASISILGPAPCALERLHGRTRWQVFVRTKSAAQRGAIVDAVRASPALKRAIARERARLILDVDPVHLL